MRTLHVTYICTEVQNIDANAIVWRDHACLCKSRIVYLLVFSIFDNVDGRYNTVSELDKQEYQYHSFVLLPVKLLHASSWRLSHAIPVMVL